MDKPVLLEVKDLKTYFYSGKHALKAVDSVSFSIREGEVFGLVGESGSGKSITCKSLIAVSYTHLPKKYIRRMPTQNAGTAMTTSAEVFTAFPAALCLFTPEK